MTTFMLNIEDSAVDKVRWMLEHFKDEVELIGNSGLDEETQAYMHSPQFKIDQEMFKKVLGDVQSGQSPLMPLDESTKNIKERLESKYGDR